MKTLILGSTGQDGSYLAELLLEKGYEVHCLVRRTALFPDSLRNIQHILDKIHLHFGDLESEHHLCSIIHELKPDEIYNLAAQSDVRLSFDIPEYTGNITGIGTTRLLEAVRKFSPSSKVYQASSSEMFGSTPPPQNELSPMIPRNPYAVAKLYAYHTARVYREAYGMFVCSGILFNHESERRGPNFVTMKIARAAAGIKLGITDKLELGNLEAKRDWGYAPDYVKAMWMMMQQEKPDDYVIGTGTAHSVSDFLIIAFSIAGLDWRKYVQIDQSLLRPAETNYLCADTRKAKNELGWVSSTSFNNLVYILVNSEINRLSKLKTEGERICV